MRFVGLAHTNGDPSTSPWRRRAISRFLRAFPMGNRSLRTGGAESLVTLCFILSFTSLPRRLEGYGGQQDGGRRRVQAADAGPGNIICRVLWVPKASVLLGNGTELGPYTWSGSNDSTCFTAADMAAAGLPQGYSWNRTGDLTSGARKYNVTVNCTCSTGQPGGCYSLAKFFSYSWWAGPPWMLTVGFTLTDVSRREVHFLEADCDESSCASTLLGQPPPFAQLVCRNSSSPEAAEASKALSRAPEAEPQGSVDCRALSYQLDYPASPLYGKGNPAELPFQNPLRPNDSSCTPPPDGFKNRAKVVVLECNCTGGNGSCYHLAGGAGFYFGFVANAATYPIRPSSLNITSPGNAAPAPRPGSQAVMEIMPWDCTASKCLTSTKLLGRYPTGLAYWYADEVCYNKRPLAIDYPTTPFGALQCNVSLAPAEAQQGEHIDVYRSFNISSDEGSCTVRRDMATKQANFTPYFYNVSDSYKANLRLACRCLNGTTPEDESGSSSNGSSSCYDLARHASLSLWDGPLWQRDITRMLMNGPVGFTPGSCTSTDCLLSLNISRPPYASALCTASDPYAYQPQGIDFKKLSASAVPNCTLSIYNNGSAVEPFQQLSVTELRFMKFAGNSSAVDTECRPTTYNSISTKSSFPQRTLQRVCSADGVNSSVDPKQQLQGVVPCGSWGFTAHLRCSCVSSSGNCYRAARHIAWVYSRQAYGELPCGSTDTTKFFPWHCTAGHCFTSVGPSGIFRDEGSSADPRSIYSQAVCALGRTKETLTYETPITCTSQQLPPSPPSPTIPPLPTPGEESPPPVIVTSGTPSTIINVIIITSVGVSVGVAVAATAAAAILATPLTSQLTAAAHGYAPLINLLQHTQFLSLTGAASAKMSATYIDVANSLGWTNFRYPITGLRPAAAAEPAAVTNTVRRALEFSSWAATGAADLAYTAVDPVGRRGLLKTENTVTTAPDASRPMSSAEIDAYDSLLVVTIVLVGALSVHWLLLRLWVWLPKLARLPLPELLVFPSVELRLLDLTVQSICAAAGTLLVVAIVSQRAVPIAIATVSTCYIVLLVAGVCLLVATLVKRLSWYRRWLAPWHLRRFRGALRQETVQAASPVLDYAEPDDGSVASGGGHGAMASTGNDLGSPLSGNNFAATTTCSPRRSFVDKSPFIPIGFRPNGSQLVRIGSRVQQQQTSTDTKNGGSDASRGGNDPAAQGPPSGILRKLSDVSRKLEVGEWASIKDLGWDDDKLEPHRTEIYLEQGLSLRALLGPFTGWEIAGPMRGDRAALQATRTSSVEGAIHLKPRQEDIGDPEGAINIAAVHLVLDDSRISEVGLAEGLEGRLGRGDGGGSAREGPEGALSPVASSDVKRQGKPPEVFTMTADTRGGQASSTTSSQDTKRWDAMRSHASNEDLVPKPKQQLEKQSGASSYHTAKESFTEDDNSNAQPPLQPSQDAPRREPSDLQLKRALTTVQITERYGYAVFSYQGDRLLATTFLVPKTILAVSVAFLLGLLADEDIEPGSNASFILIAIALVMKASFLVYTLAVQPYANRIDEYVENTSQALEVGTTACMLALQLTASSRVQTTQLVLELIVIGIQVATLWLLSILPSLWESRSFWANVCCFQTPAEQPLQLQPKAPQDQPPTQQQPERRSSNQLALHEP